MSQQQQQQQPEQTQEIKDLDLKNLENRIQRLETIIGNSKKSSKSDLIKQVSSLEQNLNQIINQSQMDLFLKKIDKLNNFLNNYDTNYSQLRLTAENKCILVLQSQQELYQIIQTLEEIQKLKRILTFDPIIDLQSKKQQIQILNTCSQVEFVDSKVKINVPSEENLAHTFIKQNENTEDLLNQRGLLMKQLNKKFIYLDCLVSILEQQQ